VLHHHWYPQRGELLVRSVCGVYIPNLPQWAPSTKLNLVCLGSQRDWGSVNCRWVLVEWWWMYLGWYRAVKWVANEWSVSDDWMVGEFVERFTPNMSNHSFPLVETSGNPRVATFTQICQTKPQTILGSAPLQYSLVNLHWKLSFWIGHSFMRGHFTYLC